MYSQTFADPRIHLSGIYSINNLVTGKVYIGSASSFYRRWRSHLWHLEHGQHKNKHLQCSWNKYGRSAFRFNILEICEHSLLIHFEQRAIDAVPKELLYNARYIANSPLGMRHSLETRKKISEANKGKGGNPGHIVSPEARARISVAHKGKVRSAEWRAAMSASSRAAWAARTNRTASAETRAKRSASLKASWAQQTGRSLTPETRAKISAANKGKTPPPPSPETRAKTSEMMRALWASGRQLIAPEHRAKAAASNRGQTRSSEARARIRAGRWGKDYVVKVKAKKPDARKAPRSPEVRAKISATWLRRRMGCQKVSEESGQ